MLDQWIIQATKEAVTVLVLANLNGRPANDLMSGVVKVLAQSIARGRQLDAEQDYHRILQAAESWIASNDNWPTPRQFASAMPKRPRGPELPPPVSAEQARKNKQMLERMAQQVFGGVNG